MTLQRHTFDNHVTSDATNSTIPRSRRMENIIL
jgi:hypothetical protein